MDFWKAREKTASGDARVHRMVAKVESRRTILLGFGNSWEPSMSPKVNIVGDCQASWVLSRGVVKVPGQIQGTWTQTKFGSKSPDNLLTDFPLLWAT